MHLVQEQDGLLAARAQLAAGGGHHVPDVLHAGVDRRQLDEPAAGRLGDDPREGGLAGARRAPQQDGRGRRGPGVDSTSRRSGAPAFSRWSWPSTSSSVRGRIRTASGATRRDSPAASNSVSGSIVETLARASDRGRRPTLAPRADGRGARATEVAGVPRSRRPRPAPPTPPVGGHGDASAPRPGVGGVVVLLGLTSLFTDLSAEMVAAVLPALRHRRARAEPVRVRRDRRPVPRRDGGRPARGRLRRRPHPAPEDRRHRGLRACPPSASSPCCRSPGRPALGAVVLVDRAGKGLRTAPRRRPRRRRDGGSPRARPGLRRAPGARHRRGPGGAAGRVRAAGGDPRRVRRGLRRLVRGGAGRVRDHRAARPGRPCARLPRAPRRRPARVLGLLREPRLARLLAGAALLSALSIGDGFLYLAVAQREDLGARVLPAAVRRARR